MRFRSALVAVVLAVPLTVVVPTVAQAATCTPPPNKLTWSSATTSWVLTGHKGWENFTGAPATWTKTITKTVSVDAGVTTTGTVSATANVKIASLGATTGLSLQASGSKTATGSESVTYTVPNGGTTIFYAGTRKATGSYTEYKANCTTGVWVKIATGTARSWTTELEGGLFCGTVPPANSLASEAKKKCP